MTFRKLYKSSTDVPQNKWIDEHSVNDTWLVNLFQWIKKNGRLIDILSFGAHKYGINGISSVIDNDCMSLEKKKDTFKYLILRPDCFLYTDWIDNASLLF